MNTNLKKISDDCYIGSTGELYVFCTTKHNDVGKVEKISVDGKNMEIKKWGTDNLLPNRRDEVLMNNNIVGELISKKREILLGKGLIVGTEEYKDGEKKYIEKPMRPEVRELLYDRLNILEDFLDPAAIELYKNAGFIVIGQTDAAGRIIQFKCKESKYMRAENKKKGKVKAWWYCSDWKRNSTVHSNHLEPIEVSRIPVYEKGMKGSFVIYKGNKAFYDGYYFHPPYWGGRYWIEFSNAIPVFHEANLNNRYGIAFKITFPDGYFLDKNKIQAAGTDEEAIKQCYADESQAKLDFLKKFNQVMMGAKNAGKTIHSTKKWNAQIQDFEEITIEEITYDMKDDALLKAWDKSNEANIAGQGINPAIANIPVPGKLSSGSEIRNAYLFYVATALYWPRKLMIDCIETILKSHNLYDPDEVYTFEDFVISKLDEETTAMKNVKNGTTE